MAIVTKTDRPKSVRNRCEIEVFGGVFLLSRCFLDFSVGVRDFVIRLSQISSFFSYCRRSTANVRSIRMAWQLSLFQFTFWLTCHALNIPYLQYLPIKYPCIHVHSVTFSYLVFIVIQGAKRKRKRSDSVSMATSSDNDMTKASENESQETTQSVDNTAIADWLRMVNWSNYCHPTGVV